MQAGRAVSLLRRLSASDSKFKGFNVDIDTKDLHLGSTCFHHRDFCRKRFYSQQSTPSFEVTRQFSINSITMSDEKGSTIEPKFTNRLINEKSPYLLQHAHNPVDWYPWCQEAFDKANIENKLIFLSVGYSTCHWCHVMEKESFESEEIAQVLNEHYVSIKVDREERPDIDNVYMLFIRATIGGGGWPMSVFLAPNLKPLTGGTYFPPADRWGRPGFKSILLNLSKKWNANKQQFIDTSNNLLAALQKLSVSDNELPKSIPDESTWNECINKFISIYEPEFGGFGAAPKFPQSSIFNFLFHYYARDKTNTDGKKCLDMCLYSLKKIANGGIHDHVSSGFARYSVDNDWHVPHFEKMLYDQAQLLVPFTDAYLVTKDQFYANVVKDIVKYVNRDLRHDSGGYFSAEDADSYPHKGATNKKEGAFCVWEYKELESLLGSKTIKSKSHLEIFCDYFSVEKDGNISPESDPHEELTNKNVLIIYGSKEKTASKFGLSIDELDTVITECTDILYDFRQGRPRPHLDSKIICSWNGLMIAGLSQASQGLGEKSFVDDAIKTAVFIKEHLYDNSTMTLIHSCYRDDNGSITQLNSPINGFLDDYAFLIKGLLDLYEASLELRWLDWAKELQQKQDMLFWDAKNGGYFTCSAEDKTVVLRLKEDHDGAEPSGNSVSCNNLLKLAALTEATQGSKQYKDTAEKLLAAFASSLSDSPAALPHMCQALMFYHDSPTQVIIAGNGDDPRTLALAKAVRSRLLAGRVLAVAEPGADTSHVLSRVKSVGDAPTAYVCRRYACSLPVTDVKQLEKLLDEPPTLHTSKGNM